MSSSRHLRRLGRLERALPGRLSTVVRGREGGRTRSERRIIRGDATTEDFEIVLSDRLEGRRADLVACAVRRGAERTQKLLAPPLDPLGPWAPRPLQSETVDISTLTSGDLGDELLSTPATEPYPDHLYQELVDRAHAPVQTSRLTDTPMEMSWELQARIKPQPTPEWSDDWRSANTLLVLLGEDRGQALRHEAASAIQKDYSRWKAFHSETRKELLAGTAYWSHLMVWFQINKPLLRAEAYPLAIERYWARQAGYPLSYTSMKEYVAELLSYPPDEDPPWDLEAVIKGVAQNPPDRHPDGLRNWAEAHMWRQVLEGFSVRGRSRVAELIKTSPVPATGGFLTPRGELRDLS